MKVCSKLLIFAATCASMPAACPTSVNARPVPQQFVVVGDSLSAGVQNFSLLDVQQPNGYASVIAKQAGWQLCLPLVPFPGVPNKLEMQPNGSIAPVDGTLPFPPRDQPNVQANNIAVPGLTVASALTLRPSLDPNAPPEQGWATVVLGFPYLPSWAPTEIELATAMRPKFVIEWLGNNDALVPALVGQLSALTPIDQFALNYAKILDRLSASHPKLVTATIPDVTEIGFFLSPKQVQEKTGISPSVQQSLLGIGPNDYVRISALAKIPGIVADPKTGPLTTCDAPISGLGTNQLPCILTAADAKKVRATVNCYNGVIKLATVLHGGVVVDINRLVNQIYINGYSVAGHTLTTNFLGGLFSLDGIHPTNTGYAIIANEFITTMNTALNMKIPKADLSSIFATDPLSVFIPALNSPQKVAPPGEGAFCFTN
jgi:hypothetical protein